MAYANRGTNGGGKWEGLQRALYIRYSQQGLHFKHTANNEAPVG